MSLLAWILLAALVVVVVAGSIVSTMRTLRTWRDFRSLGRSVGDALADVLRRAGDVEEHALRSADGGARLAEATARLQGSLAELAVLTEAAGEVRTSVRRGRALVPRK
jgi:acetyl-CoA carboxylase beta subunit